MTLLRSWKFKLQLAAGDGHIKGEHWIGDYKLHVRLPRPLAPAKPCEQKDEGPRQVSDLPISLAIKLLKLTLGSGATALGSVKQRHRVPNQTHRT
jgi:hypothetical protein